MIDLSKDIASVAYELGLVAQFYPTGTGNYTSIRVIFLDTYSGSELFGANIENNNPVIVCNKKDITTISHKSVFIINSISYGILRIQNNSVGQYIIEVSKQK